MRRVAVTGMGVISPLGLDEVSFWSAISQGRSGIAPMESVDRTGFRFSNAGEVRGFDAERWMSAKDATQMDRVAQLAAAAASQAVSMAGLELNGPRAAAVTGCSVGGKRTEEGSYHALFELKKTRFDPLTIPKIMANSAASWLSMRHGITGPCYNVSTACASAAHAIGQAFWMVRTGQVDVALTGGCEAPLATGILRAWESMRVVSPDTCRPFSKGRRGLILAEGSAMFVLEPLEAARSRGAQVLAEIIGFGMSADASHLTTPSEEGGELAIRAALSDASLTPAQVDYINAHGTGTQANDVTETRAIRRVFGQPPPVSSTKSMHGHALGASPALELAAVILAMQHQFLPPTIHFEAPDPECDLDVVPNAGRAARIDVALSNSFAFGGLNAVLAVRRPMA